MRFLFKVFHLNSVKTLFKISKKISKEKNKSRFKIFFDMIKCAFKYQAGFYDYLEFEFYELNDDQRETYLTRGKNNKIILEFNDKTYFHFLDNKLEFNNKFKKYVKRDFIDMDNVSLKDFEEFIYDKGKIIVKPSLGSCGKGIRIIDLKNVNNKELFDQLIEEDDLLIEEVVNQHEDLNKLYGKSVNTLRMFTFCKNDRSYFLQAILKLGNGGVIDNFSSGGMYAFLNEEGKVITSAIDQEDNVFKYHPISKEKIIGFQVPYIKEAIELVKNAALEIPEVGYIGWDVAISDKGPVIIEGNSYPGIFQIKASLGNKEGLVPKYEDIMGIKF